MTKYACKTLEENVQLASENSVLRVQNRELLARCDLLAHELEQEKDKKEALERQLAVLIDRLGGVMHKIEWVWGEKSHQIKGVRGSYYRIEYWGLLIGPWFFGLSRSVDEKFPC